MKKENMYFFGMKAHIGVDTESGLMHSRRGLLTNSDLERVQRRAS
ncbi:hypothetical protein PVE_P0024 (plasmid) [Pseudomonas veronii 1YdBTEX2]|jgi:IS5 family transposase|uniref:Transposase IS4-like domain-containing protein n=1 Tax=Pseudomonas veronii 1YdBTEX2 TaxID=1295141 RepID=A0A1D3K9N9_PSEVE|nr:hypothetical protein PVE_P0024 [Pseudomonas veronii 1YdBTEX2]